VLDRKKLLATLALVTIWLPGIILPVQATEGWAELVQRGRDLSEQHKYQLAAEAYKQALKQAETFGEGDPRLTASLWLLGTIYENNLFEPATAAEYLERQQTILRRLGPDYSGLADGMELLARTYMDRKMYDQAEKLLLHALRIAPRGYALSNKDYTSDIARNLGQCYMDMKRYNEAEKYFNEALSSLRKRYGKGKDLNEYNVLCELGNMYNASANCKKAIPILNDALAIADKHPEWVDSFYHCLPQYRLGQSYQGLGDLPQALTWYKLALKSSRHEPDSHNLSMYCHYPGIATIERKMKHTSAAEQSALEALRLARERPYDKECIAVAKEVKWFLHDLSLKH
jgi:tetratricopeptide (TPR) repeat protein